MAYSKAVPFPLQISVLVKSANVTNCAVKLCNTAKRNYRRSVTCPIDLPVQDSQFVLSSKFSQSDECGLEMVSWMVSGPKQGNLAVKIPNNNEVKKTTSFVLCVCAKYRHHCLLM